VTNRLQVLDCPSTRIENALLLKETVSFSTLAGEDSSGVEAPFSLITGQRLHGASWLHLLTFLPINKNIGELNPINSKFTKFLLNIHLLSKCLS
jgi:hypothetical protein